MRVGQRAAVLRIETLFGGCDGLRDALILALLDGCDGFGHRVADSRIHLLLDALLHLRGVHGAAAGRA